MTYDLQRDKLFDNIMYLYQVVINDLTSTVQSNEIDLDLPRGYVAKLAMVIFECGDFQSPDNVYDINIGLINDPDDETTVSSANQVKHDVVASFNIDYIIADATNGIDYPHAPLRKMINFKAMDLDVVSARNMRVNASDEGNNGDANAICEIYYTIEKVKGSENLLNLLDIL